MKKAAMFFLLCFAAGLLGAQENAETTFGRDLTVQISSLPEAKLVFFQHMNLPFLRGEGMLTRGNNIDFALGAEVTPISLNGLFKTVWTPAAFFNMTAGGRIGSGWPLNLFGGELHGIGINREGTGGVKEYSGSAFDGALWNVYAGGMVQMDFGLLLPWEWDHIVFQTYHEINYSGYTRAQAGEAWFYEDDFGENCNGFNYYGSILLGYQMPIFLNTVAVLTEMDSRLYDTPNRGDWGDERVRWKIAAVLGFKFTNWFDVKLITQFRTLRNYRGPNGTYNEQEAKKDASALYYRNRPLDTSNPVNFHFYRVAAIMTFKL